MNVQGAGIGEQFLNSGWRYYDNIKAKSCFSVWTLLEVGSCCICSRDVASVLFSQCCSNIASWKGKQYHILGLHTRLISCTNILQFYSALLTCWLLVCSIMVASCLGDLSPLLLFLSLVEGKQWQSSTADLKDVYTIVHVEKKIRIFIFLVEVAVSCLAGMLAWFK